MADPINITVTGERAPTGDDYYRFNRAGHSEWLSRSQHPDAKSIVRVLEARGMLIDGTKAIEQIGQAAARVVDFEDAPIMPHAGWCEGHFGRSDVVVSPRTSAAHRPIYGSPMPPTRPLGGGLDWRSNVVKPLAKQPLFTLAFGIAIASMLVDILDYPERPIFEISAPSGSGKTLLQAVAASVGGDPRRSIVPFAELVADPHGIVAAHADHPLFLEDPAHAFAGVPQAKAATQVLNLILKLGAGVSRTSGRRAGPIALLMSSKALLERVGPDTEVGALVARSVISLALNDRVYGVFDSIPTDQPSASAFARHMLAAANANYGQAAKRYLPRLVEERAKDEAALQARLRAWMGTFRRRAEVDPNRGNDVRIADAFALVFAALKLAQKYEVLPVDLPAGPHILACYHLHLETTRTALMGHDALQALTRHPDVIDLAAETQPKARHLRAGKLFVEADQGGITLSIRAGAQKRYCRRWQGKVVPADLAPYVQPAKDRQAAERRIGGVKDRFYRFYLPDANAAE